MRDGKVKIKIDDQEFAESLNDDAVDEFDLDEDDMDMCDFWPSHSIFNENSKLVRIENKQNNNQNKRNEIIFSIL